jgi:2',3'-cyclic-nucleotide 2'-phosphodiesterase (5'-nucleotidase family)/endonuclease/exonuclease/phosphatase family metal-dependent hydrolase
MAEFTLQLLHASDLEGGVEAIANAPNFAAIVDALEEDYENTLVLSAGDNYIPGPFFSAAGDSSLAAVFQSTYEDFYKLPEGSLSGLEEGVGRVDISIMNFVGFDASAFGNHEFDLGPDAIEGIIAPSVDDSDDDGTLDTVEWLGAQFPYISANLDFSNSPLAGLVVDTLESNSTFQSEPPFDPAAVADTPKIAPATIIEQGGKQIGVVGVTTPLLNEISSPRTVEVIGPTSNNVEALAATIQPSIDALRDQGINKIVLTGHLQQLAIDEQLVPLLSGVDIVISGGSDTLLADETDVLRPGDEAAGDYPLIINNADGDPTAIVSTAGEYTYVGRLVIDFDENGVILPESINPEVSGQFATTDETVTDLYGSLEAAFADETRGEVVRALTDAVAEVVNTQDGNVFGLTDVFLEGRREEVRTQETNLGNLTADANLFYSQFYDDTVQVSIKNGGGIRAPIGEIADDGTLLPPQENPASGKDEGEVSELDISNSLRFNNELSLLTVTAEELDLILEYGVSATAPGATPGQFPQVGGLAFSFDPTGQAVELDDMGNVVTAGDRLQSLAILGEDGTIADIIVEEGKLVGDPSREIRLVTLNFLAGGGDGYPFDVFGENRVDLAEQPLPAVAPNDATFVEPGTEQDALAEYFAANFPADADPATSAFMMTDTPIEEDERIQNLSTREDTVLEEAPGEPGEPSVPDFSDGFEGPFSEIGRLLLEEGAEINAFDPASATLFVVSGGSILQAVDLSDPANLVLSELINLGVFGGGVNSVAVKDGIVALAVEANTSTDEGSVVFLTTDGQFLESVGVGAVPDMVTFTPDGSKVLVANEGEPNDDYSVDPEGSVSIIDLSGGVENATAAIADFTAFNDQKAELRAEGVKLFGLDATVAEDLEPEYIAVSPDGSTAWVTLQENNAVAVVDIENATVQAILPLGAKDLSKGQPELTSYEISDRGPISNGGEALTTATGETIELGGLSGLFFDGMAENGNLKFLAVPDRGPTGDVTDGNRPFLLPDYQARIVSLELNESTGEVTITNELLLTRADGTPITGLPNIPSIDERAVDAAGEFVDLDFLEGFDEYGTDYDPLGADLEGIVRAPDDTYWMVDEYRPAIYHFDTDGTLINRFVPEGTAAQANAENPEANFAPGTFGTETLPAEYFNRRANRGFEGMALDTDEGILYAFIQTPLSNPDRDTGDNSTVIRMLGIDPTSGDPVAEYVYLLQKPDIGGNVDKIGDAVYAGDGKFFVMERDSSLEPTGQKFIFEVDLKGATNVLGADFGGETLEQQTADDLAALGINPVNKLKVTNLPSIGYLPSDKPEGLAYLPDGRLAVLNDNDFGLVPGAEAVELGIINFSDGNQLDASNEDGGINIRNWPVFGLYQPDAIASYEVDGMTYYVTANEGDARLRPDGDLEDEDGNVILEEGAVFNEENRVGDEEIVLDPEAFPNAEELKLDENLGRLNITNTLGDTDGDGDFDQLFSYGGRSFSIWDSNGNLVFDSGDDIAKITAELTPELFNANDGIPEEFDQRSDDKGAEPEAVTVGQIGDTIYAFVSLERAGGGVLIYDVTNPAEAEFVQYVRNDQDIAPEGLTFISDFDSPNGNNLLVVTNEESNTLTIYSDGEGDGGNGGAGTTSIFDIQGAGHISPLLGETVTTTGIVTAVDTNGFYLQDAEGDGDIATSDALFVFTGGEPGVAVGDALNVTGTVSEFIPGGPDTGNLSTTQISGDLDIEVLSSGNELPAAVIIGEGGRIPPNVSIDDDAFASFDPETDGIDFFESLEAMRVTAQDALAIAGTNRFGEIFTVVDGGESATGISDRGTLNISPDDFNPEKVQIDENSGIFDIDFPNVDVGAFLGDVTGVVGYSFGNFEIYPTEDFGAQAWNIEYSGWWDAEGGGMLSGTLFAQSAAADDGILTPEELLGWEWNWSGNEAVSAFSIDSTDAGADIQEFGPTGFYVDGTPNLPDLADDLDQGVFVGGKSGEWVLDLEFLTVEDNSETFPTTASDVTIGDPTAATGEVTVSDPALEVVPSPIQPEVSNITGGEDTLTVASYNVLNLDPNDEDGDEDIANGRFTAIAEQIVSNLNAPDVIGLQEIQDNSGSVDDGTVAADETLQLLVDAIAAAGGPQYEFIDNTFIEDGVSGGQPGGNIRTAFLYNPERVSLVDGSVQPVGDQAEGSPFAGARLPLAATFEFNGEEVTIVNNHFSSKGGSAPILGVEQPFEQRQEDPDVNGSLNERRVQAQAVNNFVDDILAEDADANMVVLGDLNEFEFISPLEILAGTVESTDDGFGIEPTGEAAILNNLVNTIDPDERYSFIFQGNSQVLDHILVSDSLSDGAEFDFVHVNVEFAETDSRASDHEPILASFDLSDDMVMPVEELLDLTGFDGEITANITLSREAAFDNVLQFYETDAAGSVGGLLPGEAGYEDAVRQNLISDLELFVENLTTTEADVLISGGTYYAPALLVDGDPQNLVTIDDAAMGMSMIQREDNVWRFEDLTDFDFNDFVLTLNSAEAATTAA